MSEAGTGPEFLAFQGTPRKRRGLKPMTSNIFGDGVLTKVAPAVTRLNDLRDLANQEYRSIMIRHFDYDVSRNISAQLSVAW